jgi:hypothetical protein
VYDWQTDRPCVTDESRSRSLPSSPVDTVSKPHHLRLVVVAWVCASVLIAFSTFAIGYRGLTLVVLNVAFAVMTFVVGASIYWNFWHPHNR